MENLNSLHSKKIVDAHLIVPLIHEDSRGTFVKYFPMELIDSHNHSFEIKQVNLSKNPILGTIRGLHYQIQPQAEYKLVTCLQGSVFDVIIDLRKDSPTFGCWDSFTLSPESGSLLIPPMVAHGFQSLTDNVSIMYLHSSNYSASLNFSINPLDNELDIRWPLPISNISNQDKDSPSFAKMFLS